MLAADADDPDCARAEVGTVVVAHFLDRLATHDLRR
jgi:hypothetical protein